MDECNSDSGLTGIGRLSLRNKLLLFACNFLLIQNTHKQHSEIHGIDIEPPVIAADLPCSGTTHLLILMAADQRLRSLPALCRSMANDAVAKGDAPDKPGSYP